MLDEHLTKDCPKAEVLCPFSLHGCDFKVSSLTYYIRVQLTEQGYNNSNNNDDDDDDDDDDVDDDDDDDDDDWNM